MRTNFFMGGELDGISFGPFSHKAARIVTDQGTIYAEHLGMSSGNQAIWVAVSGDEALIAEHEVLQPTAPGAKRLTMGDVRAFVAAADACGMPATAEIRGELTWRGNIKSLRAIRPEGADPIIVPLTLEELTDPPAPK